MQDTNDIIYNYIQHRLIRQRLSSSAGLLISN